jgi:hypothetical protein
MDTGATDHITGQLNKCYHQILTTLEMSRDGDGLREYVWKIFMNRPSTRVWARLPVYL